MIYYIYKDTEGYWRWTLEAANRRKLADSGEGYHNEKDCLTAISLVKGSTAAPVRKR